MDFPLSEHFHARSQPGRPLTLRGPELKAKKSKEDEAAVGGLRCTARACARVPGHLVLGASDPRALRRILQRGARDVC